MITRQRTMRNRNKERGNTIFILAAVLFSLLGMGALAVDIASLYVARNEAQRVADSAALAGAKYFVESGCVTTGSCSAYESVATARATLAAGQNLIGGQPATVNSVTFNETAQNPQITVQVSSNNLHVYFAGAIGWNSAPTLGATATAEAWNPSGSTGGPIYCTGCVRPWLIANCDSAIGGSSICGATDRLLNVDSTVAHPDCTPGGVVGESISIGLQSAPTLYGAIDVSGGTGNTIQYQQAIPICSTGQQTCGNAIPFQLLPWTPAEATATQAGVENLLHITAVGLVGQDYIDTTVCPPQIHAGAQNPLVTQGVIAQDAVVATSDSIVSAYIFDGAPLAPPVIGTPQPINVVGFAQIFVTQVDGNGNVFGKILGVAGCGQNIGSCGAGSGSGTSINSPTLISVRLITPSN